MTTVQACRRWTSLLCAATACLGLVSAPELARAGPPYELGSCTNASPAEQNTASWVMACVDAGISAKPRAKTFYVPRVNYDGGPVPANFRRILRSQCDDRAKTPKRIVDGKIIENSGGEYIKADADRCYAGMMLDAMARMDCGQVSVEGDAAWGQPPTRPGGFEACIYDKTRYRMLHDEPAVWASCRDKEKRGGETLDRCIDQAWSLGPDASDNLREFFKDELRLGAQARTDAEKLSAGKEKLGLDQRETPIPREEERRDPSCRRPGMFLLPNPDGFGSWTCQYPSRATWSTNESVPEDASQRMNGSASGQSAIPTRMEAPARAFAVPAGAAPRRSSAGQQVGVARERSFRAAPRTRASTITGKEFGDGAGLRSFDNRQMAVVATDGRKISVKPMMAALQKVAPGAAQNPFVAQSNGTLVFSNAVQVALAEQRKQLRNVGGIELDVTFDSLAQTGLVAPRADVPTTAVENPILISLQRLVAAAKPYASSPGRWAQMPDELRYPGGVGRVRGFVLDPATKDVFIVGTPASSRETRLDIDVFTILMDVTWARGLTPGVSLDRQPGQAGEASLTPIIVERKGERIVEASLVGRNAEPNIRKEVLRANYPRIINLPPDAVISRLLLDADFEMKRVVNGALQGPSKSFESTAELMSRQKDGDGKAHARFWFHPIPLNADTVRVAGGGNIVLYDAGVRLLTENLNVTGAGAGDASQLQLRVATSFTEALSEIENWPGFQTPGIFTLLKGVTDVQTMCKLLREGAVDFPVLDEFRKLPYRHLAGAQGVPDAYRGVTVIFGSAGGNTIYLSGGIELRSRSTRRSFDHADDAGTAALQDAASRFPTADFQRVVPVTFTLLSQKSSGNVASELTKLAGARLLASGQTAAAAAKFADAASLDPLDIDGWVLLSIAQASAGQAAQANAALAKARLIDPDDDAVRAATVRVALLTHAPLDLSSVDQSVRSDVSDQYAQVGFSKLNVALATGKDADIGDDVALALKLGPENPQAYFLRGIDRFIRNDFARAAEDFGQVIRLWPDRWDGYQLRGASYLATNQFDGAIRDFDRAIQLKPDSPLTLDGRGKAYLLTKNYKAAIADLDKAIALRPGFAWAYFKRGRAWQELKDVDRAIADFSAAISADPNHSFALSWRGLAFAGKGQKDKALEDYDRSLKLDPQDALTHHARADLLREKGDQDGALRDYTAAIDLAADDDRARTARAMILLGRKNGPDAIKDLDEAIRLNPTVAMNFILRGDANALAQNGEKALGDYNAAIKLDPNSTLAYVQRGVALTRARRPEQAFQDFDRAATIDPSNALAFANRGKLFLEKGDTAHALADLDKSISLEPTLAPAFVNRGTAYRMKGDLERASSDFETALRLDPDSAAAHGSRGEVFATQGKWDAALADYNEAIRIEPRSPEALTNRGNLHSNRRDTTHALADYAAALAINPNFVYAHTGRGELYRNQKNFDAALDDFNEAVRLEPRKASRYFNRGLAYLDKGDADRAISDFSQAISLDAKLAYAYARRGDAYLKKSDDDRALADFGTALGLAPNDGFTRFSRALLLRAKRDVDGAIADLNEAVRSDPDNDVGFTFRGELWLGKRDYDRASTDFETALRLNPKNTKALFSRGLLHRERKENTAAIADFGQAIALDPKAVGALTERGQLLADSGDLSRALDDFTAALQQQPEFAPALLRRGRLYTATNRTDLAIADLTSCVRIKPNEPECYYLRGNAHLVRQDDDHATDDYSTAIRIRPNWTEALVLRGRLLAKRGQMDKAFADFDSAVNGNPKSTEALYWRGAFYDTRKDEDHALSDFSAALQVNPRHVDSLVARGRIYALRKDATNAMADFSEALRNDPRNTDALYQRGLQFIRADQYARAIEDLSSFLTVNPLNSTALYFIALSYRKTGDIDRALSALDRAIALNPRFAEAFYLRGQTYLAKGDRERAQADGAMARRLAN